MDRFSLDLSRLLREQPVHVPGPEKTLEGLWRPAREPRGTVVVAHPHPAYGGTMLNRVVFHVCRVLNHDLGLSSLRFNFRGVGRSGGEHDAGRGEVDDVLAAWREARRRQPAGPLVGAGFSFGAAMTLLAVEAAPESERPGALAVLGLPVGLYPLPQPFPAPLPLAAVHGERDDFTAPETLSAYLGSWSAPVALLIEAGADHYFEGHLAAAAGFLSDNLRKML